MPDKQRRRIYIVYCTVGLLDHRGAGCLRSAKNMLCILWNVSIVTFDERIALCTMLKRHGAIEHVQKSLGLCRAEGTSGFKLSRILREARAERRRNVHDYAGFYTTGNLRADKR